MRAYSKKDLEEYLREDSLMRSLEANKEDSIFVSHKWLLEIPAKRMIYKNVYGEVLQEKGKKILDVGGGFSALSRELIKNNQYTLLDIMAHDDHEKLKNLEKELGNFWVNSDWSDFTPTFEYDYVIANDLFPNVDQRLNLFIKKFKPFAKKIILTLSCYDKDRFYKVKRLDAEEILTIQAWTSDMTINVLNKHLKDTKELVLINNEEPSIFDNGRKVYKVII